METLRIGNHEIGASNAPYIIAEIGSNHNGDMDLCRTIIEEAVDAGADAVKFQSWSKKSLIAKAEYARRTEYGDKKKHFGTLEEMVDKYQFTEDQHREVFAFCKDKNVEFLSSSFSPTEVDLLEDLGVRAHKIASMDINHHLLLKHVAKTKKPILLSTGMATLAEIDRALDVLRTSGSGPVVPLHCVSVYPPDYRDINLKNIRMLQQTFDVPVGFSDHSIGTAIPLAAVALGACVIEKHFTINKNLDGWDHRISADPQELRAIASESRNVFLALGSFVRTVSDAEHEKRTQLRRRIVASRPVSKGAKLRLGDLDFKRPGNGINPDEYRHVVGRRVARDVEEDHEFAWSDFE